MNRINRYFCVVLTALIKKAGENHRHHNNYKLLYFNLKTNEKEIFGDIGGCVATVMSVRPVWSGFAASCEWQSVE